MNKKYQVFVSSTYIDLLEERKAVIQALLELDCIPAGMELFPASNDSQWNIIKSVIDSCDYYIVIVGGRYGSIHPMTGKSYTQMEYEYALQIGLPIIGFLHGNPENIVASKVETVLERIEKLEDFKKLVSNKVIKYWNTLDELGAIVSRSIIQLISTHPQKGWIKADTNLLDAPDLTKEQDELKLTISKQKEQIEMLTRERNALLYDKGALQKLVDDINSVVIINEKLINENNSLYKEVRNYQNKESSIKKIKIFLASSKELEKERQEFELFINRENKILYDRGIFLHLEMWEDFIDTMSPIRKQNDYNKAVKASDIFISLFFTKAGKYTNEEFDAAYGNFIKNNGYSRK